MILTNRTWALLFVMSMVFCPTVALEVAKVVTGASDGSDGWQIPEGAAMELNPEPLNAAVLAKGQRLFKSKCQRCHGADGAGHGPEADPNHAAGDLTDGHRAPRNPDGVMFYKSGMAARSPRCLR